MIDQDRRRGGGGVVTNELADLITSQDIDRAEDREREAETANRRDGLIDLAEPNRDHSEPDNTDDDYDVTRGPVQRRGRRAREAIIDLEASGHGFTARTDGTATAPPVCQYCGDRIVPDEIDMTLCEFRFAEDGWQFVDHGWCVEYVQ